MKANNVTAGVVYSELHSQEGGAALTGDGASASASVMRGYCTVSSSGPASRRVCPKTLKTVWAGMCEWKKEEGEE